jgi:hypothetical protein
VRRLLAEVLRSWDVTGEDGQPLQPPVLEDLAAWHAILNERAALRRAEQTAARAGLSAEALALVSADPTLAQALVSADPTLAPREDARGKKGRAVPADAWSAADVKAAYVDAWEAILREVQQPFLTVVYRELLGNLLPGKSSAGI